MFDDLKIRNKLVLLVAGPIVIIVLLAALGARSRQATADGSQRVQGLVGVAQSNSDVVNSLQQESLVSTTFVASGRKGSDTGLTRARKATDATLAVALDHLRSNQGASATVRSGSTLAIDAADKLSSIRDAVDQGYRWDQVATTYASTEGTFLSVNDTISEAVTDPEVASELRTGAALAAYKAAIAQQGSLLAGAAAQGGFGADGSFALLKSAVANEGSALAIFNSIADTLRKGQVRDALTSDARITLEGVRDQTIAAGGTKPVTAKAEALATAAATVLSDLHGVEASLFDHLISQAKATSTEAARAANVFLIAAVLAIAAAAVAAVLLGRRITRPLNELTEAADRLATEQMPRLVESLRNPSDDELGFSLGALKAIRVTSGDEIGRLAASFNDVQRVAGEVAAEQAALLRKGIGEMFVNLARRNQALLDRQIEFIDELERGEEDPDALENLYRLDHLATRMRRNAESLLVLAGAEPPRRRGRPAPLANVVRAALAEVEDFNRIELLSFDEILIASNAAADLAHLLSELMENATNFSPPETRVEVVGHRTKADGYVISVTDHGIGMSSDQIIEANDSLARPPLVGLALSRSLGFIVVGRLAGRHGIAVRMMPSPAGGVTSVVSIPPSLVTDALGMGNGDEAPMMAVPSRLQPAIDVQQAEAEISGFTPLSFTPYDAPEEIVPDAPATLADAVPTGSAFDAGLDSLFHSDPAPSGPTASPSAPPAIVGGLPTRRLSAAPANARVDDPEPDPVAVEEPAPTPAVAPEPPGPLTFAPSSLSEDEAPAPILAPAAHDATLPEAIAFSEPATMDRDDAGPELGRSARLDGPPPSVAPLAIRTAPSRPVQAPEVPEAGRKPFFLEDAEPPRLFGRSAAPEAPAAPTSTPDMDGPSRLFGSGSPAVSTAAVAPTSPAPPATPAIPVVPVAKPLARRAAPAAVSAPEPVLIETPAPVPAEPSAAVVSAEAVRTTAGLAKRTPRPTGGGGRAIPGADAERGVSATRRSPDEVRSLLSRYRDGQQRARVEEPANVGPAEESETP